MREIPTPVAGGAGVVTRPVLVRPGWVAWQVHTAFFHSDTVTRTEFYETSESYPCEEGMCTRSVPQARTVTEEVRVNDAVCQRSIRHLAVQDGIYILQYDFFADARCSLHCFLQVQHADGSRGNTPCEVAPPPG